MVYSLKKEELEKLKKTYFMADFIDAEMLSATYVTDANVVKEIIPKPLLPAEIPLATVFVAHYPKTNFGCIYNEGALFVHCEYKKEAGLYCLSMPVDDDMALIGGREQYGYPKKMADKILLEKTANRVIGKVIRKNEEILKIDCELGKALPSDFTDTHWVKAKDWDDIPCYKMVMFLYKFFQSPGGNGFDYIPRLIREPILMRKKSELFEAKGKVEVSSTPVDTLGEVSVKEIKNIIYGKWHSTMLPGKVIGRAWNVLEFAKHAFSRTDFAHTLLQNYDPIADKRAREIFKAAMKF